MRISQAFTAILLVLMLLFVYNITLKIHWDYPYPFHVDEYQHIAKAIQTINEERIVLEDPNFKNPTPKVTHEEGFHVLLSTLAITTKIDLIRSYMYFPAASAAFSAFTLYVLLKKITSKTAALTSILFFSTIKSNVNILGLWFYTPFSASIPVVYLASLSVITAINSASIVWLVPASLMTAALYMIHPLSALFVTIVSILYALINLGKTDYLEKKLASSKTEMAYLIMLSASMMLLLSFQSESARGLWRVFLERVVFPRELIPYDVTYSIAALYGAGALVCCFLGVFVALRDARLRFFVVWVLFAFSVVWMYDRMDYTLFLPYHRAIYLAMLGMVPLSAGGFCFMVRSLFRVVRFFSFKPFIDKILFVALVVLTLTPVLWNAFQDFYELPGDVALYRRVLDDSDYAALSWFSGEYGGGNVVLAPIWNSVAVYPLSGNFVVATIPATIGGGPDGELRNFFDGGCNEKEAISGNYGVDFVYSVKQIDCPFLKEVFSSGRFIYKVVLGGR